MNRPACTIVPPTHLLADGQLHRCDYPASKDAAYILHMDGLPDGGFENHRDGQGWQNWHANIGRALSDAEREHHHARIDAITQQRQTVTKSVKVVP